MEEEAETQASKIRTPPTPPGNEVETRGTVTKFVEADKTGWTSSTTTKNSPPQRRLPTLTEVGNAFRCEEFLQFWQKNALIELKKNPARYSNLKFCIQSTVKFEKLLIGPT